MSTCTVKYLGELRTEARHTKSGHTFVTDAPTDNHGKGEAFSPTDLIAASLLSCMISVMGIAANARGWELGEIEGEIQKTMASNPRRVAALAAKIRFRNNQLDGGQRHLLEQIALECPVAKSLDPAIEQLVEFEYL